MAAKSLPEPKGRRTKLTDADLRKYMAEGKDRNEIAALTGLTYQAVRQRELKLGVSTVAAVVAPEESKQYVGGQIKVLDQLQLLLERCNLMLDACHEDLSDPSRPGKYTLSPQSWEIDVTHIDYSDERPVRKKDTLANMLDEVAGKGDPVKVEIKRADTRELLLKTSAECRAIVQGAVKLGELVASLQSAEMYVQEFLKVLEEADPPTREKVVQRVRSNIRHNPALGGFGGDPAL